MAFSGANVTCASAVLKAGAVLTGHVAWAEFFPSGAGQTVQATPQADMMLRVSVSADTWVCYGVNPDDPTLSKSRRYLVRAGYDENFFVHNGTRVAMSLA